MQDNRGVGRLAIAHRRLEANLFGSLDRVVVKAVSEAAHNTQHAQVAGGFENDLEKNFTFNAQAASLGRVDGNQVWK